MLNLNPFFNAAEGAAGGGAPAANTSAFPQQGSQGTGSQAAAAWTPTDDAKIVIDGKETTWKDYQAGHKTAIEGARTQTRTEIENNLRKLAQTLQAQQRGQQQQPQGQQRVDPLAGIRDNPIIAGKDLAAALDGTLGPVAQAVAQLQQQNQQLAAQVKKLSGGVGTLAKERSGQERSTRISSALAGLNVEGLDLKDETLNELAADVLDAWEFDKPEEYAQMLTKRFTGLQKLFRALDKKALETAKSRRFVRPGGTASPSGQARFDPRNGAKHAADILFGPVGQTQ